MITIPPGATSSHKLRVDPIKGRSSRLDNNPARVRREADGQRNETHTGRAATISSLSVMMLPMNTHLRMRRSVPWIAVDHPAHFRLASIYDDDLACPPSSGRPGRGFQSSRSTAGRLVRIAVMGHGDLAAHTLHRERPGVLRMRRDPWWPLNVCGHWPFRRSNRGGISGRCNIVAPRPIAMMLVKICHSCGSETIPALSCADGEALQAILG